MWFATFPVVFKVLENSGIPTEVLIMEQHLDTMDEFLDDGRAMQFRLSFSRIQAAMY